MDSGDGVSSKTYTKDETGDALALLIVMFYLSNFCHYIRKLKSSRFKRR